MRRNKEHNMPFLYFLSRVITPSVGSVLVALVAMTHALYFCSEILSESDLKSVEAGYPLKYLSVHLTSLPFFEPPGTVCGPFNPMEYPYGIDVGAFILSFSFYYFISQIIVTLVDTFFGKYLNLRVFLNHAAIVILLFIVGIPAILLLLNILSHVFA